MHVAHHHAAPSDDRLLLLAWRVLAGIAVTMAIVFLGTVVVEAVLPTLPDQARAGTATAGVDRSGAASDARGGQPAAVEHFHTQFNLRPGVDLQPTVETF